MCCPKEAFLHSLNENKSFLNKNTRIKAKNGYHLIYNLNHSKNNSYYNFYSKFKTSKLNSSKIAAHDNLDTKCESFSISKSFISSCSPLLFQTEALSNSIIKKSKLSNKFLDQKDIFKKTDDNLMIKSQQRILNESIKDIYNFTINGVICPSSPKYKRKKLMDCFDMSYEEISLLQTYINEISEHPISLTFTHQTYSESKSKHENISKVGCFEFNSYVEDEAVQGRPYSQSEINTLTSFGSDDTVTNISETKSNDWCPLLIPEINVNKYENKQNFIKKLTNFPCDDNIEVNKTFTLPIPPPRLKRKNIMPKTLIKSLLYSNHFLLDALKYVECLKICDRMLETDLEAMNDAFKKLLSILESPKDLAKSNKIQSVIQKLKTRATLINHELMELTDHQKYLHFLINDVYQNYEACSNNTQYNNNKIILSSVKSINSINNVHLTKNTTLTDNLSKQQNNNCANVNSESDTDDDNVFNISVMNNDIEDGIIMDIRHLFEDFVGSDYTPEGDSHISWNALQSEPIDRVIPSESGSYNENGTNNNSLFDNTNNLNYAEEDEHLTPMQRMKKRKQQTNDKIVAEALLAGRNAYYEANKDKIENAAYYANTTDRAASMVREELNSSSMSAVLSNTINEKDTNKFYDKLNNQKEISSMSNWKSENWSDKNDDTKNKDTESSENIIKVQSLLDNYKPEVISISKFRKEFQLKNNFNDAEIELLQRMADMAFNMNKKLADLIGMLQKSVAEENFENVICHYLKCNNY